MDSFVEVADRLPATVYTRNVREITVRDGTSDLIEKDLRRSAGVAPVRQSA